MMSHAHRDVACTTIHKIAQFVQSLFPWMSSGVLIILKPIKMVLAYFLHKIIALPTEFLIDNFQNVKICQWMNFCWNLGCAGIK